MEIRNEVREEIKYGREESSQEREKYTYEKRRQRGINKSKAY
jgi:hypothetical protein